MTEISLSWVFKMSVNVTAIIEIQNNNSEISKKYFSISKFQKSSLMSSTSFETFIISYDTNCVFAKYCVTWTAIYTDSINFNRKILQIIIF